MRRALEIAAGLGLCGIAVALATIAGATIARGAPLDANGASVAHERAERARVADEALPAHADPVASYTMHASLDVVKHTVNATGTITWRNASRVPASELYVHLYLNAFKNDRTLFMRFPGAASFRGAGAPSDWGHITVSRFALQGGPDLWPSADKTSPGDPDDETDIRLPLPEPVAPGATIAIDVAFESKLPSLTFRTGHSGGFHMVAQWFPKIARREPDGRWSHFAFHHLSEFYADYGTYDVTIDTPDDVVVGATGEPGGESRTVATADRPGRISQRFVQADVHDFAFTAWNRFQELDAVTEGGVRVRVLFPPGYDRAALVELDSVRFGLAHFGEAYGRYPYRTLTVVHPPDEADEAGGMEYPTLITTGGPWFSPWSGAHVIDIVTLHELGHQWFYGLVGTDEHAYPFLDEGINSYAEADVMEAREGYASAFGGLGFAIGLPAINRALASDAERNAPVAQGAADFATGGDYGSLVYQRTATILATIANVYGADRVRAAIGAYARKYRFQHPGPDELLAAIREGVGDDAAEQLRVALFDRGTVDYAVSELVSEPDDASGKSGAYRGSALVRRRGSLRFPVDVDLVGADGSVQRVRWDAAASAERLPYHGASKLVAAVVDPDHRVLLDDDLGNNARRTSPSAISSSVLDRFTFAIEALLAWLSP